MVCYSQDESHCFIVFGILVIFGVNVSLFALDKKGGIFLS
jgi:hypothetical protein